MFQIKMDTDGALTASRGETILRSICIMWDNSREPTQPIFVAHSGFRPDVDVSITPNPITDSSGWRAKLKITMSDDPSRGCMESCAFAGSTESIESAQAFADQMLENDRHSDDIMDPMFRGVNHADPKVRDLIRRTQEQIAAHRGGKDT